MLFISSPWLSNMFFPPQPLSGQRSQTVGSLLAPVVSRTEFDDLRSSCLRLTASNDSAKKHNAALSGRIEELENEMKRQYARSVYLEGQLARGALFQVEGFQTYLNSEVFAAEVFKELYSEAVELGQVR